MLIEDVKDAEILRRLLQAIRETRNEKICRWFRGLKTNESVLLPENFSYSELNQIRPLLFRALKTIQTANEPIAELPTTETASAF